LNVFLIDDEMLALTYLEYQLQKIPNVRIVGMHTNPLEGMEQIRNLDVDVVFLDIHMPGTNGLQLAEQIIETETPCARCVHHRLRSLRREGI
jgi:Response regulator of the LytR/AlgR family